MKNKILLILLMSRDTGDLKCEEVILTVGKRQNTFRYITQ